MRHYFVLQRVPGTTEVPSSAKRSAEIVRGKLHRKSQVLRRICTEVNRKGSRGPGALSRDWAFHDVFHSSFFPSPKIPCTRVVLRRLRFPSRAPIRSERPVTACFSLAHATVTRRTGLNNPGVVLVNASSSPIPTSQVLR